MDYRKLALENLCCNIALENIGFYAQSVKGGDNPYEKRTERMEGHNEALMKVSKYACIVEDFISKCSKEVQDLLLDESIYIRIRKEKVSLYVLCNDVFYYACADCEEIKDEEIKDLMECYKLSEVYGGILWASRKRKMKPLEGWFRFFSEEEKELFDAVEK